RPPAKGVYDGCQVCVALEHRCCLSVRVRVLRSGVPPSPPTHSQPVTCWNVVVLSPMQLPTATIALVIAATSWIPGAIGAPTMVPWFTRLDPYVLVFGVDVMGATRRVTS